MTVQGRVTLSILAGIAAGLLTWFVSDVSQIMRFPDVVGPLTAAQARQQQIICMVFGGLVGAFLGVADGLAVGSTARIPRAAGVGVLVGIVAGTLGLLLGQSLFGHLYVANAANPVAFVGNIFARALGWGFIGALVGTADGWRKLSFRVGWNGFLGGAIGGVLGGTTFEIVPLVVLGLERPGILSRLAGFVITGAAIGLFVALVQQLLKEAWIRVVVGRNEGREYLVDKAETKIGRAELSDVPLFGDTHIARTHAVLIAQPGGRFVLRDEGGPAGTLVNGERITGAVPVRDGDTIQIGGRTLIFHERLTRRRTEAAPKDVAAPRPAATGLPSLADSLPPLTPAGIGAAPVLTNGSGGPPPVGPRLVATSGPYAGRTFPLEAEAVIGRDPGCDISLAGDYKASRTHARLVREGAAFVIEDTGSTNGTFVNGQRVTRQTLVQGDTVIIGGTAFRLE